MDTNELIEALNGDLQSEFRSIVQYVQHVAIVTGPEFVSTVDELRAHLTQELQHALALSEQVAFLGGTPSVKVPEPPTETDSRRALQLDLDLETAQLERYRERTAQATEMGLVDVAEAVRPLLTQTQDHVRDLQAALGL